MTDRPTGALDCPSPVPRRSPGWATWLNVGVRVVAISGLVGLAVSLIDRTLDSVPGNVLYSECIGLAIFAIYGTVRSRIGFDRRSGVRDNAISGLLAIPLGFLIGVNVASWLTGSPAGFAVFSHVAPFAVVVTATTSVAFIYFFWSRGRLAEAAVAEADARQANAEAQLKLLQTQIEPHMLFNTLANLRTLVDVDPVRAQAMIDQLIVYLRGTLGASRNQTVTLAAEFAQLSAYLGLMQVRMAARLRTELILPEELGALPIPPMLLQPLVENAIKHGLEPKIAGGLIRVEVSNVRSRIRIDVEDDGVGLDEAATPGYGVTHVRERLRLLYGDRASVAMETRAGGGVRVRIEMPR
jgi:signal transduction histidine kinase